MVLTTNILHTNGTAGEIGVSLEHDPELMYFTWKVNLQNRAANMATIVERTGLLSLILTDKEWDDYSANRSVAADGSIVIAP